MPSAYRRLAYLFRRALRGILRSNDSPRQIAGGVAVGTFVGFMPTMGGQMISAALLATLFRCSRIPAMAMVYITNPFTAIPIYGTCYFVGVAILNPFGFHPTSLERLKTIFSAHVPGGPWEMLYVRLVYLLDLGVDTLAPLWLGCLLCGAVAAIILYYITLRLVTGHRLIKVEKLARRAQKRLERVRQQQERDRVAAHGASASASSSDAGTGRKEEQPRARE